MRWPDILAQSQKNATIKYILRNSMIHFVVFWPVFLAFSFTHDAHDRSIWNWIGQRGRLPCPFLLLCNPHFLKHALEITTIGHTLKISALKVIAIWNVAIVWFIIEEKNCKKNRIKKMLWRRNRGIFFTNCEIPMWIFSWRDLRDFLGDGNGEKLVQPAAKAHKYLCTEIGICYLFAHKEWKQAQHWASITRWAERYYDLVVVFSLNPPLWIC